MPDPVCLDCEDKGDRVVRRQVDEEGEEDEEEKKKRECFEYSSISDHISPSVQRQVDDNLPRRRGDHCHSHRFYRLFDGRQWTDRQSRSPLHRDFTDLSAYLKPTHGGSGGQ